MKSKRLYQSVADELLKKIQAGKYGVGERLPAERELAIEFEVSRPTMREAVIALEIGGHVEVRKGSGVYVVEEEPQSAEVSSSEEQSEDLDVGAFELTEARMLVEAEVAALAATMITGEELQQLADSIVKMQQENDQGVEGEQADREFHMIIARATRNSALESIIEDLWSLRERSHLTRRMYKVVRQTGAQPVIEEHRQIYTALKNKDPAAARSAMRNHLSRVIQNLLDATEIEAVEVAVQEIRKKVSADRNRYTKMLDAY